VILRGTNFNGKSFPRTGQSEVGAQLVNMLKIFSLEKRVRNSQLKGLGHEIDFIFYNNANLGQK
jgi:hypothetical protein